MTNTETTYWNTAGYSMIDHQLDPLMQLAGQWITDEYDTTTGAERHAREQATARALAETLRAAAQRLEDMATPAEPYDVDCDRCGSGPGGVCWNTRYYTDNKHPHRERVALARSMTKADTR